MFRLLALMSLLWVAGFCAAPASADANPALIDSPWPTYHAGPLRQASTPLPGPRQPKPQADVSAFKDAAGIEFGTSPWHILSAQRYDDAPEARAVWGVSLKYLYKYIVDGDRFAYIDSFKLNDLPFFIGWNFFGLADGRIVVPNPSGLRTREHRKSVCAGKHPALLVFDDGADSSSGIRCVGKFEFTPDRIEKACGFRRTVIGTTTVAVNVTLSGHIAVQLRREDGRFRNKRRETWMAIVDNALTRIVACAKIADGAASNGVPLQATADGGTRLFVATEDEMVAVLWQPETLRVEREAAVPIAYRGRTGTTPTLMRAGDRDWLITVDARCAVVKVFTGAIACSDDDRPSAVIAMPLPLGSGEVLRVALPDFIDTVENSPAVSGDSIVVANYSGYTPEGKKDGKPDRATGLAKLGWDEAAGTFRIDWQVADRQYSGVPTISAGSNLVYGSGSEPDGFTYFYGIRLEDGAAGRAGELVVRKRLGPSRPSKRGAKDAIYDAGNNILINDDGSAIMVGGESLIRLRDAQPR